MMLFRLRSENLRPSIKNRHRILFFRQCVNWNVKPENCIYIGDSEVDIQTAANAGIPCISVNWGFKSTEFLKENGAAQIVSTPAELVNAVLDM